MSDLRIEDRLPQFSAKIPMYVDSAMREISNEIIIKSRRIAPKKKGNLRANSFPKRLGLMNWRVEYNQEYAIYQEVGRAGSRVFRNYTTAGTGSRFLSKTGDAVFSKSLLTLRKYMSQVR